MNMVLSRESRPVVVDMNRRVDEASADACIVSFFRGSDLQQATGSEWHGCGVSGADPMWVRVARRLLYGVYANAKGTVVQQDAPNNVIGTVGGLRSSIIGARSIAPGDSQAYSVTSGNAGSGLTRVVAPVYTVGAAYRAFFGWAVTIAYQELTSQAPTINISSYNHNCASPFTLDRSFTFQFTGAPEDGKTFRLLIPAARPTLYGAAGTSGQWAPFPGIFGGVTEDIGASSRVELTGVATEAATVTVEWLHPDCSKMDEVIASTMAAMQV